MASTDQNESLFQPSIQMRIMHVPIKPMGQSQLLLPLHSQVLSQTESAAYCLC